MSDVRPILRPLSPEIVMLGRQEHLHELGFSVVHLDGTADACERLETLWMAQKSFSFSFVTLFYHNDNTEGSITDFAFDPICSSFRHAERPLQSLPA